SAAGDSGPDTAARVALTSRIGYVALLAGPPCLGFLGDHDGLRTAMLPVLSLMLLAAAFSPATAPRPATSLPSPRPKTAKTTEEQAS
ncbi:MFS transporter, partial [Streptomyces sp. SID11233]|nr:MFS transporter [Streptomyces sp. SID11233]